MFPSSNVTAYCIQMKAKYAKDNKAKQISTYAKKQNRQLKTVENIES